MRVLGQWNRHFVHQGPLVQRGKDKNILNEVFGSTIAVLFIIFTTGIEPRVSFANIIILLQMQTRDKRLWSFCSFGNGKSSCWCSPMHCYFRKGLSAET